MRSDQWGQTRLISLSEQPVGSHLLRAVFDGNTYRSASTSAAIAVTIQPGVTASGLYYIHSDHLATPRQLTSSDAAGTTVWRWEGEPYGNTLPEQDPDGNGQAVMFNPRFPGQYFDAETQLAYNYFRDYDPSTGRYIESDPIGLQGGVNTYGYVGGNPVGAVDPEGLAYKPGGGGNSHNRRSDRRNGPKDPVPWNPDADAAGMMDDLPDGAAGIGCAIMTLFGYPKACLPGDLFVCSKVYCTPSCGNPYFKDVPSKKLMMEDSSTKCVCVEKNRINPNAQGGVPGL